jgi:hypothetical protein
VFPVVNIAEVSSRKRGTQRFLAETPAAEQESEVASDRAK